MSKLKHKNSSLSQ